MECPKCQSEDILVTVKRDSETFICVECRAFWNEDMKILGEVDQEQIDLFQNIIKWNALIDEIDFQLADAPNIEKCVFCDKLAVRDGENYVCQTCGGSWSVV